MKIPQIAKRVFSILFVVSLFLLCLGCTGTKQISVEQASWLSNENDKMIVQCMGAKYELRKVKFEPTYLTGEIYNSVSAPRTSINFYVSRFTKSDTTADVIIHYDDITEVTTAEQKRQKKSNNTPWYLESLVIPIGVMLLVAAGVTVHYL